MPTTHAYGVKTKESSFGPMSIDRREPGPADVVIAISHAGICHSDVHQVREEWGSARFPMVPGHEIVGVVTAVGANVKKVKVGDRVGVGCMVDSCGHCGPCERHHEQFCEKGAAMTYNGTEMDRKTPTYGGYSRSIVVTEGFVLKMPANLDPAGAAPLLCAGITTYSPLKKWGCKKGDRLAVVGLGGLGHMAVKIGAAMGAEVTMFSTSESKRPDAERLGAKHFVISKDPSAFEKLAGSFDLIVDTISAPHDYNAYLRLLRPEGTMICVGAPPEPMPINAFSLIGGNKRLVGSLIGGIQETQEMLDFCGERNIVSDVEVIAAKDIDVAYDRLVKSDVKYRFVIDAKTIG